MRANLTWAKVDGVIRDASEFVGITPSLRPVGLCPCCEEEVVWKAGDVVVPHVAHRAGSTCAATNPETAAHLNAKARLVQILSTPRNLELTWSCPQKHSVAVNWVITPWTSVQSEYRMKQCRRVPDLMLLLESDGKQVEVGAVEIFHSHAVDALKAMDLASAKIPWVEVDASVALSWDPTNPLKIRTADTETMKSMMGSGGRCDQCAAQESIRRESQRQEAARERLRALDFARRLVEDAQREFERTHRSPEKLAKLMANPPQHHIVVAVAMSGDPGKAFGCSLTLGKDHFHTFPIATKVDRSTASWMAVEYVLTSLLKFQWPLVGATIHTGFRDEMVSINSGGGVGGLERRVCSAVVTSGSLVLPVTQGDPDEEVIVNALKRALAGAQQALESSER